MTKNKNRMIDEEVQNESVVVDNEFFENSIEKEKEEEVENGPAEELVSENSSKKSKQKPLNIKRKMLKFYKG